MCWKTDTIVLHLNTSLHHCIHLNPSLSLSLSPLNIYIIFISLREHGIAFGGIPLPPVYREAPPACVGNFYLLCSLPACVGNFFLLCSLHVQVISISYACVQEALFPACAYDFLCHSLQVQYESKILYDRQTNNYIHKSNHAQDLGGYKL